MLGFVHMYSTSDPNKRALELFYLVVNNVQIRFADQSRSHLSKAFELYDQQKKHGDVSQK